MEIFVTFIICLAIASAIAGVIMMVVRSKLKSVRAERSACNYTRGGSFKLTGQSDNFLYNRITKIPRSQNNNSRSRGRRR